jgi:hypothetical protein
MLGDSMVSVEPSKGFAVAFVPLAKYQALGVDDGDGVHRTIMPARDVARTLDSSVWAIRYYFTTNKANPS